jgi:hypothetical protein
VLDRAHPISLGRTPIVRRRLPTGSYLLDIVSAGRRDTACPVVIERDQEWVAQDGHPIPLYSDDEIGGEAWIHVPGGWTILGDDLAGTRARPRSRVWVDGFFIARREVSEAEYGTFLNSDGIRGSIAAMWRDGAGELELVPRYQPASKPRWSCGPEGRWHPAPEPHGSGAGGGRGIADSFAAL